MKISFNIFLDEEVRELELEYEYRYEYEYDKIKHIICSKFNLLDNEYSLYCYGIPITCKKYNSILRVSEINFWELRKIKEYDWNLHVCFTIKNSKNYDIWVDCKSTTTINELKVIIKKNLYLPYKVNYNYICDPHRNNDISLYEHGIKTSHIVYFNLKPCDDIILNSTLNISVDNYNLHNISVSSSVNDIMKMLNVKNIDYFTLQLDNCLLPSWLKICHINSNIDSNNTNYIHFKLIQHTKISNENISLFVKNLYGKTIIFNIIANQTVKFMKKQIKQKEGIPCKQQRLIFAGKQFEDHKNLYDYGEHGLENESTIHLALRLLSCAPGLCCCKKGSKCSCCARHRKN
jgi:ubiquitin-large subunit ribosomal protein L40e